MTEQIRGGKILARALKEKGIEHVFTLSGGFCNAALEGQMEGGIDVVNTPHEQVAGFLADGYTRLTREPNVCFAGPEGFANAVGSMIEAWSARTPIIDITASSTLRRKGAGGFKEIDDVAIAAPLTKYSVGVTDGVRLRETIDRAFKIAISGFPGAVHISVPVDIMYASYPQDAVMDERPLSWTAKPAPGRTRPPLGPSSTSSPAPRSRSSSPGTACGGCATRASSTRRARPSAFPC